MRLGDLKVEERCWLEMGRPTLLVGRRNIAERQEARAVDAAGACRSTWNGLRSVQGGAATMHEGP